jgi:hypothetical protein
MNGTTIATITHGVLGAAILAAGATLLALHDLQEPTFLALVSASIALITGSAATTLALRVPASQNASQAPTAGV